MLDIALVIVLILGLALLPFGLPGLWVMALGVLAYGWLTDFTSVGIATIAIVVGLPLFGEVLESWIGFRVAKRYGASSRAAWGALLGGLVGAVVGVPVPIVGSVIGVFVGSFVGAAILEYSYSRKTQTMLSAGWAAVMGRALAATTKIALGLVICVIGVIAIIRR